MSLSIDEFRWLTEIKNRDQHRIDVSIDTVQYVHFQFHCFFHGTDKEKIDSFEVQESLVITTIGMTQKNELLSIS